MLVSIHKSQLFTFGIFDVFWVAESTIHHHLRLPHLELFVLAHYHRQQVEDQLQRHHFRLRQHSHHH